MAQEEDLLSSKFNFAVGFAPALLSILLSMFLPEGSATYIGAGTGLLLCLYGRRRKGKRYPPFILYGTTGVLALLSILANRSASLFNPSLYPFTLEVCVLLPPFFLLLNQGRLLRRYADTPYTTFRQTIEGTVVTARLALICFGLHLLLIAVVLLLAERPLGTVVRGVLFRIMPAVVFLLAIVLNQLGIRYFNRLLKEMIYVPIVNTQGDVIGKITTIEAFRPQSPYIHPVIRIATTVQGRIYLLPRPADIAFDPEKTDVLLEGHLLFGESLMQGAERIMQQTFPTTATPLPSPRFVFMHHYKDEQTNRLVYLFLLELDDDSLLTAGTYTGGKLWTLAQIEQNLGCRFFGHCFEREFEELKRALRGGMEEEARQ